MQKQKQIEWGEWGKGSLITQFKAIVITHVIDDHVHDGLGHKVTLRLVYDLHV